jgi:hypothetical protein
MNERIKQLWDTASKLESDPSWEGQTKFMEKFAELIVQECVTNLEFHGFEDAVPYIKWMAANKLGVKP